MIQRRVLIIRGTVQPLPTWEEMYSWGLTAAERAMLGREGVYVRTEVLGSG
jgi:hypothetical protein